MPARILGKIFKSCLIGILTMFPVHGEQNNTMHLSGTETKKIKEVCIFFMRQTRVEHF